MGNKKQIINKKREFIVMCKPNIDVYHTNDRLKVKIFLKTNELIISKDTNWLGKGMYFWDNLLNAKYWKNEKLRKRETTDIKIIKGKIFLEKLLDLTDEETVKYIDDIWSLDLFSESNLTLSNKVIYSVKENICIGKFEIIDEEGK